MENRNQMEDINNKILESRNFTENLIIFILGEFEKFNYKYTIDKFGSSLIYDYPKIEKRVLFTYMPDGDSISVCIGDFSLTDGFEMCVICHPNTPLYLTIPLKIRNELKREYGKGTEYIN